jgi:hypothetical protein
MVDSTAALEFMNREMMKLTNEYNEYQKTLKINETREKLLQLKTMKESISNRMNDFYQDSSIYKTPAEIDYSVITKNSKPIEIQNDPRQTMNNKLDSYYNAVPTYKPLQSTSPLPAPSPPPPPSLTQQLFEENTTESAGMRIPKRSNPFNPRDNVINERLSSLGSIGRATHAPPSIQGYHELSTLSRNNYKDDANQRLKELTPMPNSVSIAKLLNPNAKPV